MHLSLALGAATQFVVLAYARPGMSTGSWINMALPSSSSWWNASTTATASLETSSVIPGQTPFKFPLSNGFPNIQTNSSALMEIQEEAHGTLPNGPLPTTIADKSAAVWELIAFNELFEVAFYSSLLDNITNANPGYAVGAGPYQTDIIADVKAIRAQEELHAIGANAVLQTAGRQQIQPCEYVFPSNSLESAITFAATFTDVVMGTLQEALFIFGADGDFEFLELIGSIIGQEGEQDGFFRLDESQVSGAPKIPSALPFLTAASGAFAYSSLMQTVIVPGSCPNAQIISLPIFGALNVETPNVSTSTQTIQFSFASNGTKSSNSSLSLVYINQQNVPVVETITDLQTADGKMTFSAAFPYAQYEMNGLTIAAVTNSAGPFANAADAAMAAVFGPALIEIN